MKDIVNEWNLLDTFLYKLDIVTFKMREAFGKPDAESIIEAETAYLKKENEQLKKRGYPRPVIKLDRNYFCPKCNTGITKVLEQYQIKYCPECGQRIFLNKYQTFA